MTTKSNPTSRRSSGSSGIKGVSAAKSASATKAANLELAQRRLEKVIKILTAVLEEAGCSVRREELKRGFGWKVLSGSCRLNNDKLIFVDRKMTLEDQLIFLNTNIRQREIVVIPEKLAVLSELGWKPMQDEVEEKKNLESDGRSGTADLITDTLGASEISAHAIVTHKEGESVPH